AKLRAPAVVATVVSGRAQLTLRFRASTRITGPNASGTHTLVATVVGRGAFRALGHGFAALGQRALPRAINTLADVTAIAYRLTGNTLLGACAIGAGPLSA